MNYGDSILEEDLLYFFDMFYIGDKVRIENCGGIGFGLFIVKNIVE